MNSPLALLRFTRRPFPVFPEHRPLYKIAQILLVLSIASRGGKSSTPRLHLFNWALKKNDRSERLKEAAKSGVLYVAAWGFDPALAIALRFAVAEKLLRQMPKGFELTDLGRVLADDLLKSDEIFLSYKQALRDIGKGINESMVDTVSKGWLVQ